MSYSIDWTTSVVPISNSSNIGTSIREISSFTIPRSCNVMIAVNVDINCLGNSVGNARVSLRNGSTTLATNYFNNASRDYFMGGVTLLYAGHVEAGDVISLIASTGENVMAISNDADRSRMIIVQMF